MSEQRDFDEIDQWAERVGSKFYGRVPPLIQQARRAGLYGALIRDVRLLDRLIQKCELCTSDYLNGGD